VEDTKTEQEEYGKRKIILKVLMNFLVVLKTNKSFIETKDILDVVEKIVHLSPVIRNSFIRQVIEYESYK